MDTLDIQRNKFKYILAIFLLLFTCKGKVEDKNNEIKNPDVVSTKKNENKVSEQEIETTEETIENNGCPSNEPQHCGPDPTGEYDWDNWSQVIDKHKHIEIKIKPFTETNKKVLEKKATDMDTSTYTYIGAGSAMGNYFVFMSEIDFETKNCVPKLVKIFSGSTNEYNYRYSKVKKMKLSFYIIDLILSQRFDTIIFKEFLREQTLEFTDKVGWNNFKLNLSDSDCPKNRTYMGYTINNNNKLVLVFQLEEYYPPKSPPEKQYLNGSTVDIAEIQFE